MELQRSKKLVFPFLGLLKNNRKNRKRSKMVMKKFRVLNPNWTDSIKFDIEKGEASCTYVYPMKLKRMRVKRVMISGFVLR